VLPTVATALIVEAEPACCCAVNKSLGATVTEATPEALVSTLPDDGVIVVNAPLTANVTIVLETGLPAASSTVARAVIGLDGVTDVVVAPLLSTRSSVTVGLAVEVVVPPVLPVPLVVPVPTVTPGDPPPPPQEATRIAVNTAIAYRPNLLEKLVGSSILITLSFQSLGVTRY
jgi:hypothetical protein